MNKYCILLNKNFLDDISELCNNFIRDQSLESFDNFKDKIKQELKNSSKLIYINKDLKISTKLYKDLFKNEPEIDIMNLDIINIMNDNITIQIKNIIEDNKINNLYFLKYGIDRYILFEDDDQYAKIPVNSYKIFKINYCTDRSVYIANSKILSQINSDINQLLKNNKAILDDKTAIINYSSNNLQLVLNQDNFDYVYTMRRIGGEFQYNLAYLINKKNEENIKRDIFKNLLIGNLLL